jgi:hypothetical protein
MTERGSDEEHEHKGSFAEGQEERDHPAKGAEHTGTFAEGEADEEHHEAPTGDFAEGVEQEHHEH